MKVREHSALNVAVAAAIVSAFLIMMVFAQEYATSQVTMNATVAHVISVVPSPNALDWGVLFGSINAGSNNNMAINDTTNDVYTNCTDYYIEADSANTANIRLWHYAPDMDRSGQPPTILIANVTHEANTTADGVNVNMTATTDGAYALTTSWAKIGGTPEPCDDMAPGDRCWIAYWLDVPSAILSGTYNTTYYFCGNITVPGAAACS